MISVPTILATGDRIINDTSFATEEVSPSQNALVLFALILDDTDTRDINVSGCNLDWELIANPASGDRHFCIYRAQGNPTPGAITVAVADGVTNIDDGAWIVVEIPDAAVGNNGADAIVQALVHSEGSNANTHAASWDTPMTPGSASIAFVGCIGGAYQGTAQEGWIDHARAARVGTCAVELHYLLDTSPGVEVTWDNGSTSIPKYIVALEVVESSSGPTLDPITNLSATAGDGSVALSWTPPAGATSQQLHRSTSPGVPEDGSAAIGSALAGNANQTTDATATNGQTYYYKVSATDGSDTVYSNEDSATPQAVDDPPTASITNPAGNITVSPGTEIVLEGTGTDAEDGPLVGEDLAWSSDVDGALGTGTQITAALSGTNESPVVHTVTLTATDSAEQTGTDTVTVTVGISGSGVTRARRLQTMATLYQYDPVAARRRVPLYLEDSGGAPVTGESGTPEVSVNGGTFASTTNALVEIGNGHYYVELTAAELSTLGRLVVRYNSANTVECMTLCDVAPQVVVESGAVSSAMDGQTMTVDAGLSIPAGAMVQVVTGTGAGEAGLVQSYDDADGSLVLESPGLPTTLDNTSRFVVFAAPRAGLEIDANGRVAADVEAVAGTQVASVDAFKADVSGLATAAALATVGGNVDAILDDTANALPAQIGALNDLSAAEVNAEVDAALADYGAATPADVAGAVANLSTFDPATDTVSVESIAAAAIAAIWSAARGDINPPAGSFGYYLDAAVSSVDGGSGGDSAAVIADAVLREALADHSGTAGSLAEALAAVHSRLTAARAAALDNLDAAVSSRLADADYTAPDNATIDAIAAAVATVDGIVDQILADTGTDIPAAQAALTTLAEAIKAKTDSLTFTQAGQVDANIQSINDVALTGDGSATPFGV